VYALSTMVLVIRQLN